MVQATEQETRKQVEFEIMECRHVNNGDVDYSIMVGFDDCHVTMNTFLYTSRPGYRTDVSIFNLQPEDIVSLGNKLVALGTKLAEEKRNQL